MYSIDHNEILHKSQQLHCRDVCKISLRSVHHILQKPILLHALCTSAGASLKSWSSSFTYSPYIDNKLVYLYKQPMHLHNVSLPPETSPTSTLRHPIYSRCIWLPSPTPIHLQYVIFPHKQPIHLNYVHLLQTGHTSTLGSSASHTSTFCSTFRDSPYFNIILFYL